MTVRMGYDFAITGVPEKSKDFLGKRRNSEMSELSWLHGSKRYVACDDVSEATPLRLGQGYKNDIRAKRRKDNRKKPPFYLLPRT